MSYIKQYPTPIAGLTLGIAGIAAFWSAIVPSVKWSDAMLIVIAVLVITLLLPLIFKFIKHPKELFNDLKHPTVGSVVPTMAMTFMLLSHTLSLFSVALACGLWLFAVVLHAVFFIIFSYHRIKNYDLNHIVPSWFVPPIGIVVACLTVPSADFVWLSYVLLTFGIVAYAIMLPIVIYRLSLGGLVDDARKPTLAILAAPASLTLSGYLSLSADPNPLLIVSLFSIAVLMTVSVYVMMLHLLRLPFSPAYAAFTFPLAISATALFKMSVWMDNHVLFHCYMHDFFVASIVEGIIASCVIFYVFQHYVRFLINQFCAFSNNP